MKRTLKILALAVLILPYGFAASASANSIHTAGGPWIDPIVGGSGTADASFVRVRLSTWELPPPPNWPGQPKEWIPIVTQTVRTGPDGWWRARFDVHDHPEYWGSVDCPPLVHGWSLGGYKLDLFVHGVLQDSAVFPVAHDCFGRPPIVPPGAPPVLPNEPLDSPMGPQFDAQDVY